MKELLDTLAGQNKICLLIHRKRLKKRKRVRFKQQDSGRGVQRIYDTDFQSGIRLGKAKKASDFSLFAPYLEKIIDFKNGLSHTGDMKAILITRFWTNTNQALQSKSSTPFF